MEEFAERGVELASYNKIIERSGLSKGTVYYYFDNKDSLLETVLDYLMVRRGVPKLPINTLKLHYFHNALSFLYRSEYRHNLPQLIS